MPKKKQEKKKKKKKKEGEEKEEKTKKEGKDFARLHDEKIFESRMLIDSQPTSKNRKKNIIIDITEHYTDFQTPRTYLYTYIYIADE
jgi:hypothetical protein